MADSPPSDAAHDAAEEDRDVPQDAPDVAEDDAKAVDESLDAPEETLDEPVHRFEDDADPDEQPPNADEADIPDDADDQDKDKDAEEGDDGNDDKAHPGDEDVHVDGEEPRVSSAKPAATKDPDGDVEMSDAPDAPAAAAQGGGTGRFRRIVSDSGAVSKEAASWLARVLVDGPRAVAEILAIVVSPCSPADASSGDLITQQMVMANDPSAAVRQLCADLEEDAGDASGELVASRRARSAYQEFWMRVARESSNAILYDTDCFDTVLSWLEVMSTAKLSMLRYAACLAAYSIVDGFIALGNKLRNRLVSLQRQLATEKKRCERGSGRRGRRGGKGGRAANLSQKAKELAKKVDELSANNGELIELADKVFTGIFVLKYRDVAPEIRVASVQYLGKWIMGHPDHYLDDTHSKYIGWLLSDKDPTVRRACVTVLSDMLHQADFFPSLELFLRRFLSRIVEMCRDKDNDVSMRAIRLCSLLIPFEILDQDSVDQLCDQVMEESHSGIRKAAGHFVMCLISDDDPVASTMGKSKKGDKDAAAKGALSKRKQLALLMSEMPTLEKAKEQIRELVLIVSREGVAHVNSELVHDAMWDVMPSLRSWEAYAALLAEGQAESSLGGKGRSSKAGATSNESDAEEPLSEEEKAIVCELLLASAKEVVKEGDILTAKQVEKSRDKESCEDALARIFAPLIPRLLVQFQGSAPALAALVQVPRYFAAKHFEAAMQKKHFVSLLSRLVDAISRHTGSIDVMHATVDTFRVMSSNTHPLRTITADALLKASIAASKDLRQLVVAGVQDADPINVGSVLLKTRVISELVELPDSSLADVLAVISTITDKDLPIAFNTTIVVDACHTAVRQWIWTALKVRTFSVGNKTDENFESELAEYAEKLWESRDAVLAALANVAEYPFNLRVRATAARVILTVLTLANGISRQLQALQKDGRNTVGGATDEGSKENSEERNSEEKTGEEENNGKKSMNAEKGDSSKLLDQCAFTVKECMIDLVIAEVGFPSRNPRIPKTHEDKRGAAAMVSEDEIADLSTALVQACVKGAVATQFRHLPFLGLLLNRKHGTRSVERVCKLYRAHISDRSDDAHTYAVQAISDAADIQAGKRESKHHAVALLARAIIDSAPENDDETFYVQILKSLLTNCQYSLGDVGKAQDAISILAKASSFLASRVGVEASAEILVSAREFESSLNENDTLEEEDRSELSRLMFPLVKALEAINSGTPSHLPPLLKLKKGATAKRVSKRAKAKDPRKSYTSEWEGSPRVAVKGSQEVRRSTRTRKPRIFSNYEQDNEEESEEEEEAAAESEGDSDEDVPATPPPAGEVADATADKEELEADSDDEAGDTVPPETSKPKRTSAKRKSTPAKAKSTPRTKRKTRDAEEDDSEIHATPKRSTRRKSAQAWEADEAAAPEEEAEEEENEENEKEEEEVAPETPKKRGRGRPRKHPGKPQTPSRGRGRPRKTPVKSTPPKKNVDEDEVMGEEADPASLETSAAKEKSTGSSMKRGRGRPRKSASKPPTPKRKVQKKNDEEAEEEVEVNETGEIADASPPSRRRASRSPSNTESSVADATLEGSTAMAASPVQPVKRGRGRPRKNAAKQTGSSKPVTLPQSATGSKNGEKVKTPAIPKAQSESQGSPMEEEPNAIEKEGCSLENSSAGAEKTNKPSSSQSSVKRSFPSASNTDSSAVNVENDTKEKEVEAEKDEDNDGRFDDEVGDEKVDDGDAVDEDAEGGDEEEDSVPNGTGYVANGEGEGEPKLRKSKRREPETNSSPAQPVVQRKKQRRW